MEILREICFPGTIQHNIHSRCAKQTLYGTSAQRDKSEEENEQARHIQALELAASKLIQLGLPLKENTENQIRAYLRWGLSFKFGEKELVPASENLLYYYIIWLSDSVSYGTIKNYVQAIVELHTRAGFTEFGKEIKTMNKVQTLLKALQVVKSEETGKNRKQALDFEIVLQLGKRRSIEHKRDPKSKLTCVLTAFLISLWTGSDNLVPKTINKFNTKRHLHLDCLHSYEKGYVGSLEWHKTRKKTKAPVVFSIPNIAENFPGLAPLCAFTAIKNLTRATGVSGKQLLLIYYWKERKNMLTYQTYLKALGERRNGIWIERQRPVNPCTKNINSYSSIQSRPYV